MSEERVSRNEQDPPSSEDQPAGWGSRHAFQVVAGIVMALLLFAFVIQPAVARGGLGEIVIVAAIFLAIILVERWLRTR
ncbi:MAG TPA: hypothetical protein VFM06_08420 [Candidatus Limnocylindria bacterium]|nr:hypothetical protein [Candidatus Limnocylindria bacterium]